MTEQFEPGAQDERSSRSVIGMPVISIQEGLMLGYIKQILIDGKDYHIQAFIVEKRRLGKEDRILPFSSVNGFGEDSVTVEKATMLERKGLSHQYVRALRRPLPVLGARVFTAGGKTLGKVEEYRFSIRDGSICGLEIAGNGLFKEKSLLPGHYIIAIAPQTVMMKDEAIDEAIAVGSTLRVNMENAADAVKEKAANISASAVEATKKFSANFNDAVHRLRNRDEEDDLAEAGPNTQPQDTTEKPVAESPPEEAAPEAPPEETATEAPPEEAATEAPPEETAAEASEEPLKEADEEAEEAD